MKRFVANARLVKELGQFKMPFYAVAKGKKTGIYLTWGECQEQITGIRGAIYKKFNTEEEANTFIQERSSNLIDKRKTSKDDVKNEAKSKSTVVKNEAKSKSTTKVSTKDKDKANSRALSPTVLEMGREMKCLQKQLSELRSRFDEYLKLELNSLDSADTSLKRSNSNDDQAVSTSSKSKKMKLTEDEKDKSNFTVDSDGFLVVYTDGACGFNGKHGAKAGVGVFFGENHPMNVSEPVKGRATNNTAEIQAATYALELTKSAGFDKVIINTDSQFMINCATSWMPSWKKNDWKKRDGAEVINKEDLIDLDKASDGLLVKWNYVKAHDGLPGNEAADQLAREGSKRYQKDSE